MLKESCHCRGHSINSGHALFENNFTWERLIRFARNDNNDCCNTTLFKTFTIRDYHVNIPGKILTIATHTLYKTIPFVVSYFRRTLFIHH